MTVDPAPLQLTVTHHGPTTIDLTVTGELDVATADGLHTWIVDTVTEHRPDAITLDLSRLQFIDAAGVRTLYRLHALTAAGGCALTIGPAHQVFWWTLSRLGLQPSFAQR
ncbi:STAS domain-containing protein [Actinoplanes sp. NBC_00393]|uniref:STAS domain-containing protein n=1 Tax=Actinoplanes sp. NBC_00393 TaxID=2975953 RepID=UPI002E2469E3